MPGRNFNSDQYRYSLNGQEKTDEISGSGNHTTAMYWEYDTRLGRRWNLDPKDQISISNYACFANNPVWFTDPMGDEVDYETKQDKRNVRREKRHNKEFREKFKAWKNSDEKFTFRERANNPALRDANSHYEIPLEGQQIDYSRNGSPGGNGGFNLGGFGIAPPNIELPKMRLHPHYFYIEHVSKTSVAVTDNDYGPATRNFNVYNVEEIMFNTHAYPDQLTFLDVNGNYLAGTEWMAGDNIPTVTAGVYDVKDYRASGAGNVIVPIAPALRVMNSVTLNYVTPVTYCNNLTNRETSNDSRWDAAVHHYSSFKIMLPWTQKKPVRLNNKY
jgi:hypothetical protein